MTAPEVGSAHDCDDCLPDCPHPDHLWDGEQIPELWAYLFGDLHSERIYEPEVASGPVLL